MADGYWNRQQPPLMPPSAAGGGGPGPGGGPIKRPRSDYELPPPGMPSGHDMHNYYPREDRFPVVKDTQTIGSAYDRYLQNSQASLASGEGAALTGGGLARAGGGGMAGLPGSDTGFITRPRSSGPELAPNGRDLGFPGQHQMEPMPMPGLDTVPLPPDASNTLYVEGLPPDSSRREVAHIFRPFVGYRQLRLVSKDSKHRGGDPLILCFVDFENPACAATALSALQGYKMDEHDPDSNHLRLQFSRYPGPRSGPGGGGRGRR